MADEGEKAALTINIFGIVFCPIRSKTFEWTAAYLVNRRFFVFVNSIELSNPLYHWASQTRYQEYKMLKFQLDSVV